MFVINAQASLQSATAPKTVASTGSKHMVSLSQVTRKQVLHIAREADKRTDDRSGMQRLQSELRGLSGHDLEPAVKSALHLQSVLIDSYLMGPMRNPKVRESACAHEMAYANVAAEATEIFLFGCAAGASILGHGSDDQRCAVNLGADACLIGLDGGLGVLTPPPAARFVNAVRTSASDKLVTLQAQGPKTPEQVEKLITAAMRHADQTGCKRVVFVNASTDKVPAFGDAVAQRSSAAMPLDYRELHWIDGEVPQTPEGRAVIVDFVETLSREIRKTEGKTMVVFNCHIGLDRSGVTNALTQLMVDHLNTGDTLAAALHVLKNIKRARPHGVSTVFRFHLIMRCLQDLRAREKSAALAG